VKLPGYGAHSALMEDGSTGSFCLLIPPDPTSPPSETSIQLLLGKRGNDSSSCFLLTVGGRGRGGAGALVSG
jgi:hypothetical protein